jgi:hypothetical protein
MYRQVSDPFFRVLVSPLAFILKRFCDDAYRENAHFAGDAGHNGGGAGAGPASHPGRDKHHVRPFQTFSDVFFTLKRGISPDLRLCPRTQSAGSFRPELDLIGCQRPIKRLEVGVTRNKIDARESGGDHCVDGVAPGAADPDHLDADRRQYIVLK